MKRTKIALALFATVMSSSIAYAADDLGAQFVYKPFIKGTQHKLAVPEWVWVRDEKGNWVDSSGIYACSDWTKATELVNLGESFTQDRQCSKDQERTSTEILYAKILDKERNGETTTDNQTIAIDQSQPAVGIRDFITGQVPGDWSNWAFDGAAKAHDTWSPVAASQVADFSQSRNYLQPEVRTRTIYDEWKSAKQTFESTETAKRDLPSDESRSVDVDFTSWANIGALFACSPWSPTPDTINLDLGYTQERDCSRNQERVRSYTASGGSIHSATEAKVVDEGDAQSATGEKDYMVSTSNGPWSAWVDYQARFAHNAWSPTPVAQTVDYSQSRSYKQKQEHTRTIYDVWKSGKKTEKTTENGYQDVVRVESRTVAVSWTSWVDSNGHFGCSTWVPAVTTINYGIDFEQDRDCSQTQIRNRIYKAGSATLNTDGESKVITEGETQDAVGTKNFIDGESNGPWSAWSNSGAAFGHGTYAPVPSSQTVSYSQSRGYKQPQERTRTVYNDWAAGNRTFKSTETGTQDLASVQNRSVAVTVSSWSNTTKSGYASWSPIANAQTSTFSQSRGYTQNKTRTWTHKAGATIHTRAEAGSNAASEPRSVTVSWTAWINSGAQSNLGSWTPATNTKNLASTFTQTQSYSQGQVRTRNYSEGTSKSESKTITGNNSRSATGTKDFITGESAGAWSAYVNYGTKSGYSAYSPTANAQTATFSQSRTYTQPIKRTRTISHVWKSGATTFKSTETGTSTRIDTQPRSVTVSWTSWVNSGAQSNLGSWTPATNTKNLDSTFTQTQSYSQGQVRTRKYSEGTNKSESKTITGNNSRTATGSKDYITGSSAGVWSAYANYGTATGYSAYSPAANAQTATFSQSRTYTQPIKRTRTISNVWKSGTTTFKSTETGTSTRVDTQPRSVTVSWTSWANSGAQSNLGSWTPATSTKNLGSTFTQTQSYSQGQVRARNYSEGTSKSESKTITGNNSRSATGTKDYISSTSTGAWSAYANYGTATGHSAYSPVASAQTATFSQSRTYTQPIKRTRTISNVWKSGATTFKSTETGTSTKVVTQPRSVTVSWTSWANSGGQSNLGSWTPATSTKNLGSAFTQTQSYSQGQVRTRKYSEGTNKSESKTITGNNSRSATGTKDYISSTSTGAWSAYANYGTATGHSAYSPTPTTQTSTFSQSRTYTQPIKRTRTISNVWKSGATTFKSTETGTSTKVVTQPRSVSVSWTSWANSGGQTATTSWSPSTSTKNLGSTFTQTHNYTQVQVRTRKYSEGTNKSESKTVSGTNSRSATGTKNYITGTSTGAWSGWSQNGSNYGFGTYSPSPTTQTSTFTQSRGYTQPLKRTRTISNVWKSGTTTFKSTETGTTTSARTQSRSVTVSWSGWANSGGQTATTSWAPSTAGYNIGTNFTQTHSYRQTQVRTRSYSVGGSASESKYVYGTNSRTAAGTKNFVTGQSYGAWSGYSNYGSQTGYAGWTPGASSQTSSFTQNYTYRQQQRRSRIEYNLYANGTSTVKQTHYSYRYTYPKVYRTISVSWSGWATTSTSCGTYSPSTGNYYEGTSFTQSASCTASKRRTRTYSSSQGSAYEYTTTSYTGTRTAWGTKYRRPPGDCFDRRNVSEDGVNEIGTKGMYCP